MPITVDHINQCYSLTATAAFVNTTKEYNVEYKCNLYHLIADFVWPKPFLHRDYYINSLVGLAWREDAYKSPLTPNQSLYLCNHSRAYSDYPTPETWGNVYIRDRPSEPLYPKCNFEYQEDCEHRSPAYRFLFHYINVSPE